MEGSRNGRLELFSQRHICANELAVINIISGGSLVLMDFADMQGQFEVTLFVSLVEQNKN